MNTFLWFFLIMGILEVGGSAAYLITGVWPARSRAQAAIKKRVKNGMETQADSAMQEVPVAQRR